MGLSLFCSALKNNLFDSNIIVARQENRCQPFLHAAEIYGLGDGFDAIKGGNTLFSFAM
jgi:hypothetical protein